MQTALVENIPDKYKKANLFWRAVDYHQGREQREIAI